ncbi:MAG: phage tail protein, partial [Deltaproteobacteria bacterium CG_4_10_14_0_2_um_filter_43_8]
MARRRGGLIALVIGGTKFRAKGNFTYNLGHPKKEAVVGSD